MVQLMLCVGGEAGMRALKTHRRTDVGVLAAGKEGRRWDVGCSSNVRRPRDGGWGSGQGRPQSQDSVHSWALSLTYKVPKTTIYPTSRPV